MDSSKKYYKYKAKYIELKNHEMKGGKEKKYKNKHSYNIKMDIEKNYTETISEPWFSLISLGLKTVEGRKNKGRFKEMKIGDIIE